MEESLKRSILNTLAYFDINSYPLTAMEVWYFLYEYECKDFNEILDVLKKMEAGKLLQEKFSYFYLPDREEIVENRRANLVTSELKLKKARRAAKFVRCVPFLRAIFVCNTVASGTAQDASDIDFFIIAGSRRVWLVRFFTNIILRLFGLRTYGSRNRDKICLSFFVDDDNLNLEKLKAIPEDIHFIYWIAQMTPIYDPRNYYKRFMSANYWIKNYLPNLPTGAGCLNLVGSGKIAPIWKKVWETIWQGVYGDLLEKQAHEIQMQKMKLSVKEKVDLKDSAIVLNDGVIKLHENDTRESVYNIWKDKIKMLAV